MSKSLSIFALYLAASLPGISHGQVDLSSLEQGMAGERTQVMVLGSMHLSGMPDSFKAEQLKPVLDRLAEFKPEIITIEALSGESCELVARYSTIYPGASDYCADTAIAKSSTGFDVPTAIVEVRNALADWPKQPSSADRRRLVGLFAAANDRASALVQWLQLSSAERKAGDGISAELVDLMNKTISRRNENYLLAAVLAARLGHTRVYAIDDHTADSIQALAGPDFDPAIQEVWAQIGTDKDFVELTASGQALKSGGDMLAAYRFYNQPDNMKSFIAADFGRALKHQSSGLYGRQYVAWWETRNLRMVANIRSSFGNQPGARVLSVVGTSHKPYVDAYLQMMHDVEVVDSLAWLEAAQTSVSAPKSP